MRATTVTALIPAALLWILPTTAPAQTYDDPAYDAGGDVYGGAPGAQESLEARVWLDRGAEPVVQPGDEVRVYYRTSDDAFAAIFHIDTDGRISLLYPQHPDVDPFVVGGRDYRLVFSDGPRWRVREDPGVGYFFMVASPVPLDFSLFGWDDDRGWDLRDVGETVYEDPYVAIDDYVAAILPEWETTPWALDFLEYSVGEEHDYPRFLCYDCHDFRSYAAWDPYARACSSYRVVIWNDPYFVPRFRYAGTRVVFARPFGPRPRYGVTARLVGSSPRPIVRSRPAPPPRLATYKEAPGRRSLLTPPRRPSATLRAPASSGRGVVPGASGARAAPNGRPGASAGRRDLATGRSGASADRRYLAPGRAGASAGRAGASAGRAGGSPRRPEASRIRPEERDRPTLQRRLPSDRRSPGAERRRPGSGGAQALPAPRGGSRAAPSARPAPRSGVRGSPSTRSAPPPRSRPSARSSPSTRQGAPTRSRPEARPGSAPRPRAAPTRRPGGTPRANRPPPGGRSPAARPARPSGGSGPRAGSPPPRRPGASSARPRARPGGSAAPPSGRRPERRPRRPGG